MPVTRDEDYPAEAAQLFQAFNRCADGHDMLLVLDAAANFWICSMTTYAKANGLDASAAARFARANAEQVLAHFRRDYDRRPQPADVDVKIS